MALPLVHSSIAAGLARTRDPILLGSLAFLSVLPDFDFLFVWAFGGSAHTWHRTWSHSIVFALVLTLIWKHVRSGRFKAITPALFFTVLVSHCLVDLVCVQDPLDHGIMIFWPLSEVRLGWPVMVPLYLTFGDSPFSVEGALRFSALELILAAPLWAVSRTLSAGIPQLRSRFREDLRESR
jgi:membrane-bound metal-dependent hydrolase YbcI (DUF457 family)